MAYDTGFSRRSSSERDLQPVAIISVDPVARLAVGATRTRHTVRINCAYATGDTITTPAVGEQWYCERFDNEWRLYGRIPFNDPTLNIEPEAGQVSVGSGVGPLELNGTEVRSNAKVLRINGVYYRDSGQALERSIDQVTWEAITAGGLVQIVAGALTDYQGATQAGAVTALGGWGDTVQEMLSNFNLLWDLLCGNVFVNGLRRLGVGDSEVARIVDGLQNFINNLFGTLFCDFDGDVTPQTILARLRDLLAPIVSNPFVQGLVAVAAALGVGAGDLLNDAVAGLTGLLELAFNIITCNWDAIDLGALATLIGGVTSESPFSPAVILESLFGVFRFLGMSEIDGVVNPVGVFVNGLRGFLESFFPELIDAGGSLLKDAFTGVVKFFTTVYEVLTCQFDATELAALVGGAAAGSDPLGILAKLSELVTALQANPLVTAIQALAGQLGFASTNLLDLLATVTGDLLNWFLKIVTSILPFRALWETLLPFIDWEAVDAIETAFPDLAGFFTNGITDLWKLIFKPIDDLINLILGNPADTVGVFTSFIENLANFFAPVIAFFGDPVDFLSDLALGLSGTIIPGILENVLRIVTVDPITGVTKFVESLVGGATTLVENLLALFGIDFNAEDFDATTAINTFLTTVFGGVFGSTAAEVTRFFTRLKNLFGLADFTNVATFDFAAAATGFINNVLLNAPSAAVAVLQGIVETVTSLAFKVAEGVITGLRGFPFGVLNGVADFLQGLLDNFAGGQRGYVNSGTNLLIDAGAEKQYLWKNRQTLASYQTGVTWSTAPKKSGGGSLMVSAGNFLWWNINDLGERSPIRADTGDYFHGECYVYSYYNATVYIYARAENSLTGAAYDYYLGQGTVTASNPQGFTKVEADIQVPAGWDRISYGVQAVNYPVYVDDMMVREITAAQVVKGKLTTLNQALYQANDTPAGTTPQIKVAVIPTGIPPTSIKGIGNVSTLGDQFTDLNNTVTAPTTGLVTTVGSSAAGTGLVGQVYGTNGSGGLVGTGGRVPGLETNVGTSAAGTGLIGQVYGKAGQGGLVGFGGTTTTVTNTYNGVYGTGGLIKNLYGPTATAPTTKIAKEALPTTVGAVGSGLLYRRKSTEGATVTTASYSGVQLPYGFYASPDVGNTSDLLYQNNGGFMQIRATIEGWYQVDMAFGLSKALLMYQWYFNPVLYKNGGLYKYGNGAANAAYYQAITVAGLVVSQTSYSLCPEMVQSSFIVYLKVNETVAPGYIWHPDPQDVRGSSITSATIITTDLGGYYTYFSIGLLNRSLA